MPGNAYRPVKSILEQINNVNLSVGISSETRELSDADTKFSLREKEPPEKTLTAYKVFVAFENKPGQLFPPMAANPNGEGASAGNMWFLEAQPEKFSLPQRTSWRILTAGG